MSHQTIENQDVPWGGKRPGAGRKAPEGKLELLSVRVTANTLRKLQAEAKRRGVSLREVIEDYARQLPEEK
jgi:Ribbon-helix-helix protein, copG family